MKITIILLTTFLALFSVPVFAVWISDTEGINTPIYNTGNEITPINTENDLIHDLNTEYDRIVSEWYGPEDYDLLSGSGTDIIINATLPKDDKNLSSNEIYTYLLSRSNILENLQKYTETLEDGDRKIMFENASWYMHELIYAD